MDPDNYVAQGGLMTLDEPRQGFFLGKNCKESQACC